LYLAVLEAGTPNTKIALAKRFEREWPRSELLPHTYYLEAEAHRVLGHATEARFAAEQALRTAADHIPAVVLLAEIGGNEAADAGQLAVAERHARRAMELLETFRAPRSISLDEWETSRDRMRSRVHASLGLVAFKKGDTARAIEQFEMAEKVMPEPDAAILYRLGKLYGQAGRKPEWAVKMKQVLSLNEPTLRRLAEEELQQAK
jgi:tetratricopeptide (TPR) repeat protein